MAGSGADAAPYFRVFNPELQASKFDAHRDYVREWVPEVDDDAYPEPIVDLKESRREALDAYEKMRRTPPAAVVTSDAVRRRRAPPDARRPRRETP